MPDSGSRSAAPSTLRYVLGPRNRLLFTSNFTLRTHFSYRSRVLLRHPVIAHPRRAHGGAAARISPASTLFVVGPPSITWRSSIFAPQPGVARWGNASRKPRILSKSAGPRWHEAASPGPSPSWSGAPTRCPVAPAPVPFSGRSPHAKLRSRGRDPPHAGPPPVRRGRHPGLEDWFAPAGGTIATRRETSSSGVNRSAAVPSA